MYHDKMWQNVPYDKEDSGMDNVMEMERFSSLDVYTS